jgi:hypothetical protein
MSARDIRLCTRHNSNLPTRVRTSVPRLPIGTTFGRLFDRPCFRMSIAPLKISRSPERSRSTQLLFRLDPMFLVAAVLPPVLLPQFVRASGDLFVRHGFPNVLRGIRFQLLLITRRLLGARPRRRNGRIAGICTRRLRPLRLPLLRELLVAHRTWRFVTLRSLGRGGFHRNYQ